MAYVRHWSGPWRSMFFCVLFFSSSFHLVISVSAKFRKINRRCPHEKATHSVSSFVYPCANILMQRCNANRICCAYNLQIYFPGIKVVDTISKIKRLLLLSSITVEFCDEILKCPIFICISFVSLTKQCRS